MPDIESRNTEVSQNGSETTSMFVWSQSRKVYFLLSVFFRFAYRGICVPCTLGNPLRFPRNNKTDRITRQINRIPASPALRWFLARLFLLARASFFFFFFFLITPCVSNFVSIPWQEWRLKRGREKFLHQRLEENYNWKWLINIVTIPSEQKWIDSQKSITRSKLFHPVPSTNYLHPSSFFYRVNQGEGSLPGRENSLR